MIPDLWSLAITRFRDAASRHQSRLVSRQSAPRPDVLVCLHLATGSSARGKPLSGWILGFRRWTLDVGRWTLDANVLIRAATRRCVYKYSIIFFPNVFFPRRVNAAC